MIRFRLAAVFTFFALAVAPSAHAAPGDLDSAFGTGGVSLTTLGSEDAARDVAVQPDGKLVSAGSSFDGTRYRFALTRHAADGSLDPTFGVAGKVVTQVGSSSAVAEAIALQPDGKIVVAGHAGGNQKDFAVARYNADGTLDTSFSGDGILVAGVGNSNNSSAHDVVVQPDGRIAVAGEAKVGGGKRFALARYTSAGVLDGTFGAGGTTTTTLLGDATAYGLALQADGRLVAVGAADGGNGPQFALARYTTAGALDASFGTGGIALPQVGVGAGAAFDVVVDPAGGLLVGGSAVEGVSYKFAVARLTAAGALDSTFGTAGVAFKGLNTAAVGAALARQADGRIVIAGDTYSPTQQLALARFEATGAVDSSFGTSGAVTLAAGSQSTGTAVAIQADGKIVAGGSSVPATGTRQFALARYVAADPPPPPPPPGDGGGDTGSGDTGGGDTGGGDTGGGDTGGGDTGGGDTGGGDTGGGDTGGGDTGGGDTGGGDTGGGDTGGSTGGDTGGSTGGDTGGDTGGSTDGGGSVDVQPPITDQTHLLPPDVKPMVLPKQPLTASNTGLVAVRVKCIDMPIDCRGTIVIYVSEQIMGGGTRKKTLASARRRKVNKKVRIARRKITIPAGTTANPRVQLSAAAKRVLKRRGSIRVQVRVSMEIDGEMRTSTQTMNLRKR